MNKLLTLSRNRRPHCTTQVTVLFSLSMRLAKIEYLIRTGSFARSLEWKSILSDLRTAISSVVWPPNNSRFILNPSTGRGRGEGNGVKPIKEACILTLKQLGWNIDERKNPLRLDATKSVGRKNVFGVEWETGNISSSHRAINRLLRGYHDDLLVGGALIVPTRDLYRYLTDRVGNLAELEPYFKLWRATISWKNGVLAIIAVEHDGTDPKVLRITKGTDGRALI